MAAADEVTTEANQWQLQVVNWGDGGAQKLEFQFEIILYGEIMSDGVITAADKYNHITSCLFPVN